MVWYHTLVIHPNRWWPRSIPIGVEINFLLQPTPWEGGGRKTRGSEEALNADVDVVDLLVEASTLEMAGKWDRGGERKGILLPAFVARAAGSSTDPWRPGARGGDGLTYV